MGQLTTDPSHGMILQVGACWDSEDEYHKLTSPSRGTFHSNPRSEKQRVETPEKWCEWKKNDPASFWVPRPIFKGKLAVIFLFPTQSGNKSMIVFFVGETKMADPYMREEFLEQALIFQFPTYLEPGVDRYLIYWQLGAWFQIYRELEDQGRACGKFRGL